MFSSGFFVCLFLKEAFLPRKGARDKGLVLSMIGKFQVMHSLNEVAIRHGLLKNG